MPDPYEIAWWLNEVAQPIAIVGVAVAWIAAKVRK